MNIKGDIAIIGMSGRFPGADDVSGFWDNLRAGRDSIRTLSDEALRAAGVSEAELADPDYVKAAATLNDVDRFDPGFFRISPREAELIDPQIRLLLQCAWETLEDAGRAGKGPQNIGVFAGAGGVATSYFAQYINLHERFDKLTAGATHLGNDKDFLSTYLSYKLNLTGPSMTVQTACSTSLVALHQARLSLLSGECDMALAGGVSVRVPHGHGYQYKDGYIFSRGGRVRSFDADADGVVFGSGLGLVLIKRLDDALRDGDAIHAIVKGSAIGNDGKGKMSYAASSAKGQIACIRAALANAGVDAASIGLVETHGTGTAMGDPEEVKALAAAFKEHTDAKGYCALGAVKANVGHLEAAAGVVGLIKAALAVKHGAIPPMAHYRAPNPRIKFDNSPFYIDPAGREWRQGKGPRRAAVNSLGVGGTNAFAIVEQHVPARRARGKGRAQTAIFPLSARTDESLRAYALKLADFLDGPGAALEPADVAFTLQEGREAMESRAAFAASSLAELSAALRAFGAGAEPPQAQGAAAAWCAREELDWSAHRTGPAPRRVHLPTYVFARERCWIDPAPIAAPAAAQLHPLLHTNTSDLREHRYSTALRGDEFFLRDHRLRTAHGATDARKVLPGVAYLEMARAAMQRALPAPAEGGGWRLRDLVWVQPVVVDAPRAIDIALLADAGDGDTLAFEVFSDEDTLHCQGQGRWEAQPRPAPLDLAAIGAGLGEGWQADALYPAFVAMGLEYGPAHRPIVSIRQDRDSLLATMRLPSAAQAGADEYVLHPSLLDGALQAATALIADLREPPAQPLVPFALDELRVWAACETEMVAWVRRAPSAQRLAKFDIDLCDARGRICAQLRGFVARAMGKDATAALLATQVWETAQAAPDAKPAGDRRAVLFDFPNIDPQALPGRASAQPLPQGDTAGRYAQLASTCFETLREVLRERPSAPVLVQFVLPAHAENDVFAGCSGLLKTASLENPLLRAQLLFVAPDIDAAGLSRLLNAEGGTPDDVLVRHGGGQRSAARWRLLDDDSADAADAGGAFKDDGVYLITGGLGGLGALFAREILSATTRATVLLSGRATADEVAAAPDKQALMASLRAAGGRVEYRQIDLSDAAKVQAAVDAIVREHGRLNGILHSAGMVADEFMLKKSAETFAAVLAPKVAGSAHLDAATRDLDLDFIALFSSLGSALGNLGQADYAAANGFLDEFAAQRNALAAAGQRRGRTVAIRWPLWREGGMQLRGDDLERLHEATGIRPMRTRTGLAMFYRSLAGHCDQTVVMEGDPVRMRVALGLDRAVAPPAPVAAIAADAVATGDLRERTEDYLRRQLSALLKLPAEMVDPAAPLEEYGIDSILALDLTKALERSFGPLAKTLFFEYLSLRELAGYFVAAHAPRLHELFADTGAAVAAPAQAPASATDDSGTGRRRLRAGAARRAEPARGFAGEPIAIVGLSGRYPQARDIDAYWDVLREGRDCIVEIPPERWDWREYYSEDRSQPGRHYSKWGGFIEGVDEFDARFFNISPREADTIDPQERLFLQQAWMAIEDAGYTRQSLQTPGPGGLPAPVGVYAGVMYGEYQLLGAEASLLGQPMGFASNPASIANRVSYALNLHGPSMVVDTMCSSSLTAIHVACQDLKLGRTSLAIAGGVNVTIHPNKYLMLSAGQFISGDGHCQSFGEGGDGYIPGEGVGAVVLKRLSDAQRDGDRIYGVIRGSALSHGGKTNGYTVPNPQAQAGAIRQALLDAGVDARQVSYLEAHGTGTKLGDPIEIAALTKVFREHTDASGFCLIGSAKSNIGHCEAAAGIAGLTKVLLQLKHRAIVPSLHSSRLNPHIDFDATPFVVNQRLRPWDAPRIDGRELPRIAGISSFGAGGSNAHLLIEEYVPAVAVEAAEQAWIVPLSARTAEQLREKARDLLAWLRADAGASSLASIAQTLQVGREAMNERLGVLAMSTEALSAALQAFVEGREQADVRRGQARSAAPAPSAADVEAWTAARDLASLLAAWVDGQALDWARLYPQPQPRLSLPAYPFARQRHWIDVRAGARGAAKRAAALHPLLHRNGSDLLQHSYTADFAGDEWFLDGEPCARSLSAAACLEMARAAFAAALPEHGEPAVLELREIAWARPGVAAAGKTLAISLFDRRGDALRFEIHAPGADAAVHCQGLAERVRSAIAPRVDVQALGRDAPATLIRLSLAAEHGDERDAYGLHPALAQAALSAAGAGLAPVAVAVARIASGVGRPVWAWVRPAVGGGFDIDLCDESGAVSAQLHGVRFALAAAPARSTSATHSDPVAAATQAASPPAIAAAPRRVAYAMARSAAGEPAAFAPAALKKPDSVALVAQAAELPARSAAQAKPTVALAPRTDADAPTAVAPGVESADDVQAFDHGNGVFAIRIESNDGTDTLTPQRIERLLAALRAVEALPAARALVLCGTSERFLTGGRDAHDAAIAQGLYGAIAGFAYPVIAAVRGAARGAGFLAAALCDFMLVGETAQCGFTDVDGGLLPAAAASFLRQRFGAARADDLLYLDRVASGAYLRAKGWRCPVAPADEIEARAFAFAAELAAKPQQSLRLLKRHLARELIDAAAGIAAPPSAPEVAAPAMPTFALASPHLALRAAAPGVAIATLRAGEDGFDARATLAALHDLAAELAGSAQCRSLVLTSEHPGFLPLAADQGEPALAWREALNALPCAVTTVLDGDAAGLGWFAALCGGVCVHRADARYSALGLPGSGALADAAASALSCHFDADETAQILLGIECDGGDLRRRFGALHVAEAGQEFDAALRAATALAALPTDALIEWKRTVAASAQPSAAEEFPAARAALVPGPVALDSAVVTATAHADGVLEIRLADRDARNLFSDAFSHGLRAAFAHVEASGAYQAVVLTGYDNYFSTGGTRDTLLAIHQGRAKFTDNPLFRLPLDCAVPVVAAIQGHAIGAGWALGMFADVAILAEESHYASPYMGYGFTPGAGATLAFPHAVGHDLARETLLSAREYTGADLAARGLRQQVLPRERVFAAALATARAIARNPRERLLALKRRRMRALQPRLDDTLARELAMHERTFVGQAETLARIEGRFGAEAASAAPAGAVAAADTVAAAAPQTDLPAVTARLRQMLSHELRLAENEIGDDELFVDLGLDSITGVTWVRRINEAYGTAIEAIKVYSYPTLAKLAQHVLDEAGAHAPVADAVAVAVAVAAPATAAAPALDSVVARLRASLAHELRLGENEIGADELFVDLGLDSITGVTWVRRINEAYGTAIEAIKVYSYPTLGQLARFVADEAARIAAPAAAVAPTAEIVLPVVAATPADDSAIVLRSWRARAPARSAGRADFADSRIAVIGMTGRFAGADDLQAFWRNLAEGRDSVGEIPAGRWDVDAYFQAGEVAPGKSCSKWMGALDGYDRFDAAFFNISPREARSMDPQQRLFLQACWHGIEHAGYDPRALAGSRCGVFAGCAANDYHQLSQRERLSGQGFTGAAPSILAARISYFLDLHGPSLSIDTACSSSLVAIANACDSLASGACDLALAGGVNVMAGPSMHIMTAQVGMLSPRGRCFAFDERADGIAPGEGVGVVVLKRLADAERDGDCIYGVVEGWGANQDGKTNGITAPNADSQARLQREVYRRFGIDPAGIGLIEAHGTGTALGDPIEVAGLKASFADFTQRRDYCALGSVKSNIGHCLAAAGVSGFIKALLALRHAQLPPAAQFERLNPHIALQGSPFYVNQRLRDWPSEGGAPRRAAINSFGFSGTNAHAVVAEYVETPAPAATAGEVLLPLSARTAAQLQQRARDLLAFVEADPAVDLRRVAHTLQTGREAMSERLAVVAGSVAELRERLHAWLDRSDSGAAIAGVWRGDALADHSTLTALAAEADFQAMIGKWFAQQALPRLADLWAKGLTLDWRRLYPAGGAPRRIGLPVYPFARERYWIDAEGDAAEARPFASAELHPLLHVNISDLRRQAYRTVVRGNERRLAGAQATRLPQQAYLDMARAAVADAAPELRDAAATLRLSAVEWSVPDGFADLITTVTPLRGGAIAFEIAEDGADGRVHCRGVADTGAETAPSITVPATQEPIAAVQPPVDAAPAPAGLPLERLQRELRESLAEALLMQASDVNLDKSFTELGLDSILGVEWVKQINRRFGTELAATRVYDYPSVRALAAYLHPQVRGDEAVVATAPAAAAPVAVAQAAAARNCVSREAVQAELRASLAEALLMQVSDVHVDKSFTELGLDSILGVEWVKQINRRYGTELAATRVYDYPSVRALATYLHPQVRGDETVAAEPPVAAVAAAPAAQTATRRAEVSREAVQAELRASLAEALLMQVSDVHIDKSFTELGLDSILGVEWVKQINRRYGTELAATRVYDYPSVRALAAYLHPQVQAEAEAVAPVVVAAPVLASPQSAPLPAPRAAAARATGGHRFAPRGGFAFAPKYDARSRRLYFYSPHAEGDFDADGEFAVVYRLGPDDNICLREHVVFGEHLLPTDAYIDLVLSACRSYFDAPAPALRQIAIANPLLGRPGEQRLVRVVFRRQGEELQFFVKSRSGADGDDETLHMQGFLTAAAAAPAAPRFDTVDADAGLERAQIPTNAGRYYAPLERLQFGASAAIGTVRPHAHEFAFAVDPFALYGGLCTVINYAAHLAARHYGASDDQFLPHRIGRIDLAGELGGRDYRCLAELTAMQPDAFGFRFSLVDDEGHIALTVEDIVLRRVAAAGLRRSAQAAPRALPIAVPRAAGGEGDKVAIIGMSCRYPMSENLDAFWDNLLHGRDCVGEVPPGRWFGDADWFHSDPRHPHTSYSKWAGLLDRIDAFDPLFFGISPAEAELIDPQQRIFLEECWKAIEHAGYAPGALSGEACGVYVGCAAGDYARVLNGAGQDTAGAAFMGTSSAILAARIAYYLNLKGPALAIDTACSSSLVAVHLACDSIRNGENRMALVGGINLLTTPIGHILTSQVGMPSRDGRCAAFDASANGIVFSEGCGVLLLKSLAQAQRDGDEILGVIEGSGINQDGKTNGITAPSSNAQERLLRQVYDRFGVDPRRIGYVEAHGTATALGDPIEVNALSAVFGAAGAQSRGCALGSVKSNIGHTGFAAGVAGMIKALLCLRQRTLVPSIHYATPNPHIDFAASPFYVGTERRDWDSAQPRVATVSSFGFSGTNAHVVVAEYPAAAAVAPPAQPPRVAVPLSARAAPQLRQRAVDLLAFVRAAGPELDLARLAGTLQLGRDAMEHRAGFVAVSAEDLAAKLQDYLDGKRRNDGVYRGPAVRDEDALAMFAGDDDMGAVIAQWFARGNLGKLMDLWVRGLDLDWSALYAGSRPKPMALPTYPFARERCWPDAVAPARTTAAAAALHPLLHRNASDLEQQRYLSRFDGSEFFLADHRVQGVPVLPAVAYLEMARAAILDAVPGEADPRQLHLRHIAWQQPIAVAGEREVELALSADENGQIEFEVLSDAGDGERLHCLGHAAWEPTAPPAALDLAALRRRMTRGRLDAAALYPRFAAMGLGYGPALQGIVAVEHGEGEALLELRLPDAAGDSAAYVLHPSAMDSALQGSIGLIADAVGHDAPALPFALESLRVLAPCAPRMQAWVRYAPGGVSPQLVKVDIDLCGHDGRVCVQMRGFSSRPIDAGGRAAASVEALPDENENRYLSIIQRVLDRELSIDEAVELG